MNRSLIGADQQTSLRYSQFQSPAGYGSSPNQFACMTVEGGDFPLAAGKEELPG